MSNAQPVEEIPQLQFASMDAWLKAVAEANGDQIAVKAKDHALTYRELDDWSNELARRLLERELGPQRRVGICCHRSVEMVVAIVATLKARAAYVPLDTLYPAEHFRHVLADADVQIVMTTSCQQGRLPEQMETVLIGDRTPLGDERSLDVPTPSLDDEAYVIYTSGSSGLPKGVAISHRNLIHSTASRHAYYDRNPQRFLLLSSFAFDSSVAGIFWTLSSGGTLVLPESGDEQDMQTLLRLIHELKVTHLLGLASLYHVLLETAAAEQLVTLDIAIVAGEQVAGDLPRLHRQRVPHAQLHNEYGPTEGTVWATVERLDVESAADTVSIGKPIDSMGIAILDADQRRVPLGTAGELYLHGPAVAKGYLNREALTQQRFCEIEAYDQQRKRMYRTGDRVYQRDSGELVFLGRLDRQLKVRGYRVELGEVEAALQQLPKIRDAIVRPHEMNGRISGLVAYLVADEVCTKQYLAATLAGNLPDFMLPTSVVMLDELPRLPNGKLNIEALPSPSIAASDCREFTPPRSRIETELAQIWASVLGLEQVGIHDNYFELGGDSIASIQVISRARRQGIQIQPRQLAQFPTIASLATEVRHELEQSGTKAVWGPIALSPIQTWFFDLDHPNPNHWNHSMLFELMLGYDAEALDKAVECVLHRHPALHTRFARDAQGQWQARWVEPESRSSVARVDYRPTDVEAFEQACWEFQSQLDLQQGPLYRVARFNNKLGGPDRLLVAVHHLAMDAVSWRILTDEIEYTYSELLRDQGDASVDDRSEYLTWLANQQTEAHHDQRLAELDFWTDQLSSDWPTDDPVAVTSVESDVDVVKCELDTANTAALRFDANDAYHTRVSDLLIAALAMAISDWMGGAPEVRLMIEGHGRGTEEEDGYLARGVGWFTCTYPMRFLLKQGELPTNLRSVKEAMRSVPGGGVGFGQLRYLNDRTAAVLSEFDLPAILFNFLGAVTPRDAGSLLIPESQVHETSRDPDSRRAHPLEINAVIEDGMLRIEFAYDANQFSKPRVQLLADTFVHHAMQVADHCVRAGSSYTPSDFPEAGLSQSELDEFLDELE